MLDTRIDQIDLLRETGLQEVSFELINDLTHLKDHQEFLYKLLTSKDSFIRKKITTQSAHTSTSGNQ